MQRRSKPNPSRSAWIFIRKLSLCWDSRFPSRSCWILSPVHLPKHPNQSKHGKFGLSNKNPPTWFNLAPQCFSQWLNNTEKWLAGHTLGHCGANFKALSASRSAWQGNHKRNFALRDQWKVTNHHHHRESMWPMCGIVWPTGLVGRAYGGYMEVSHPYLHNFCRDVVTWLTFSEEHLRFNFSRH